MGKFRTDNVVARYGYHVMSHGPNGQVWRAQSGDDDISCQRLLGALLASSL